MVKADFHLLSRSVKIGDIQFETATAAGMLADAEQGHRNPADRFFAEIVDDLPLEGLLAGQPGGLARQCAGQ